MSMFKNGTLLITGGTGSFGNAVLKRFLQSDLAEIRVFSRDEKKQDDMRKRYGSPKLKFYIGDVRDARSIAAAGLMISISSLPISPSSPAWGLRAAMASRGRAIP